MILHTRVPAGRLVDWTDQAFLLTHLKDPRMTQTGWARVTPAARDVMLRWMVTASLVLCGLMALILSKSHFVSKFNGFAKGITGRPDAYAGTIATAAKHGVAVHPAFSLGHTIPIIAVFATTAIFSYWSTFVGGELRQASTIKTANNMALGGVLPLVLVAIFTLLFFHGFGSDFMRAANGGGLPAKITVPGTPFFYLSSIAVGSTFYAILVFVLYIVFWPLITYISSLQQTRAIFAMAYDGVLPKGVTRVIAASSVRRADAGAARRRARDVRRGAPQQGVRQGRPAGNGRSGADRPAPGRPLLPPRAQALRPSHHA